MALVTNPSIDTLNELCSTIETNLEQLHGVPQPEWLSALTELLAVCQQAENGLSQLRSAMINEALENTIEEMTDEQALYLEATDSDLMDEIFSGWTQDVRIFAQSSYHSLDIVTEQEDRLQTLLERFDQHLAEPHVQGLKNNGWTSDFVTPLSDQLSATQGVLLQTINNR